MIKKVIGCLVVVAALAGCSAGQQARTSDVASAQEARRQRVAAIEGALKEHREGLLAQRGVLFVGVGQAQEGDQAALLVRVAGPAQAAALKLPQVEVPVNVVTVGDDLAADACVFDGEVYASGSRIPVECNSCRCEGGSVSVCTLLACDVGVFEQVYFTEGTQMEPAQERFLASLGSQLAEVPSLMLVAVGHTAQGEQGSLGLERAQVVARAFREAGAPVLGVRGEQAREDTRPAEQQRRVSFEASQLLFDYGSPQVTPRLAERLSRLVPLLKESQEAVVVRGFASAREGDASSQRWLGQARAGAVRDFLVSQGVPAERFAGVEAGDLQEEGEPARSYLKRYVVLTSR